VFFESPGLLIRAPARVLGAGIDMLDPQDRGTNPADAPHRTRSGGSRNTGSRRIILVSVGGVQGSVRGLCQVAERLTLGRPPRHAGRPRVMPAPPRMPGAPASCRAKARHPRLAFAAANTRRGCDRSLPQRRRGAAMTLRQGRSVNHSGTYVIAMWSGNAPT